LASASLEVFDHLAVLVAVERQHAEVGEWPLRIHGVPPRGRGVAPGAPARRPAHAPIDPELFAAIARGEHAVGCPPVRIIETAAAPTHNGPVPQAVEAGGWIYVSALFGADPQTHAIPAHARAEAERLYANLAAILEAAGASLRDVVRVGIVMRALQRDRPVFNQVWAEQFGEHRPARSAVEASDFGRPGENARFMVEAVAFRAT
jgi:2-iminobutanoate/2-iminopropanoate deaminase